MASTTTGAWRSVDGSWSVRALPGWLRGGPADSGFYQIKHHGRLVAEIDDFAELATLVPLHLLVDDRP
ncbi:hypothetical protein [Actinocatenispora comari]|jgi:hypothetical protein|uniref:Uncharacterized protein n=1 Tax=Actinocatenispora comari TaxID=2807577 RepID=A0A8J4AAV1_9ACTN|nr:hypothetical protein [Actinocatenispora comari]GIL27931.1 hypothetical protein NUM_31850 [Actinocatenispora comari]